MSAPQMTDRELLELAAKAAKLLYDPTVTAYDGLLVVPSTARCQSETVFWNPLTDDGDALRLAVKLKISLINEGDGASQAVWKAGNAWQTQAAADDYAAARLAIVCTAAEIGRAMP